MIMSLQGCPRDIFRIDGSKNEWGWSKSKVGANAILAVSMAVCRAGAAANGMPLYQYIAQALFENAVAYPAYRIQCEGPCIKVHQTPPSPSSPSRFFTRNLGSPESFLGSQQPTWTDLWHSSHLGPGSTGWELGCAKSMENHLSDFAHHSWPRFFRPKNCRGFWSGMFFGSIHELRSILGGEVLWPWQPASC